MFHQLRSRREQDKSNEFSYHKLDSLMDENRSMKNIKIYRQSNHVYHVKKSKRGMKSTRAGHSDLKLLNTKSDNTKVSDIREPIYGNDEQVTVQTEKNGNISTEILNQNSTILHIPRKTFRNVGTITSFPLEKNRSGFSSSSEPDSCDQFKEQKLAQETQNDNLKLTTSNNNVISTEATKILDPIEPFSSTETVPEMDLLTRVPPIPHFASDSPQQIHIIDVEYIDLNKKQETEFLPNTYNLSSTLYADPRNTVPSNLSTSNIVQDINFQHSAPIDYTNDQPLFSNVTGTMHGVPQNYYYLPANNIYTNMVSNPYAQLSQKVDEIQESLKIMNQSLNNILQIQMNLLNTQNDLKIEIQDWKSKTSTFESRDWLQNWRQNWLAERGITLPMSSHKEFIKFCNMLDQSPECRKIFETSIHFAISSTKTLRRNIATILRVHFDSKLAHQFTAIRNVQNKYVIAKTSFYKLLLGNFIAKSTNGIIFSKMTEADFIKALGEVLGNVKYWNKKSSD